MITGDHKNTAVAVARSLGFFDSGSGALSGEELDLLPENEFSARVENIAVYARVSPEHKLRIVRAWRGRGEIVAMTGDGVNDAPAVKEADIGVAMGITGTDVTKEVSDMVVTDDNFSSIVAAVEEGRGIYGNIRKFIHYLLSCNTGEIMVMFAASLFGLPVPLLPIHILWVNLVTDSLPALALGVEPVERDVMSRPPRDPQEKIIDGGRLKLMLFQGGLIAFCSLAAFVFELFVRKQGLMAARTAAFIVLSCSQLFHAFNCRSMERPVFSLGIFSNVKLAAAVLVSFLLLLAAVYMPFFSDIFSVSSPDLSDWAVMVVLSSLPLWCVELMKKVRGRQ
jgi:Ca2+-transporting ATPase